MKQIAFWMAILATALWLVMLVAGGAAWPGYSHVSQYISELGAVGAPHAFAVNWFGFLPIGLAMIGFALAAMLALPKSAFSIIGFLGIVLYATGYVISPFFPCDAGCRPGEPSLAQAIHNAGAIISYLAGAIGLMVLSGAPRKWPVGRLRSLLAPFALVAGIISLGCFLFLAPHPFVGLVQRTSEVLMIGWILACGFYLRGLTIKNP